MDEVREEEEVEAGVEFNIPLQKVSFDANVTGVFAQVTCEQEFENQNEVSVEAIYAFPMPEDASVAGCEMVIGDKRIAAELKEKEQAKQEYRDAVDAGHHASLLEQKRENIFRVNVGGIEPGENIKIVTTYNQRVPWRDNGGRFTIPLVVAPRFIPGVSSGSKTGGGWAEDTDVVPDASEITPVVAREGVPYTADIKVALSPGFACNVSSPSHEMIENLVRENSGSETRYDVIDIDIDGPAKPVEIEVAGLAPDRDFILCYQTRATNVAASVHIGHFDDAEYITIDVIPPGVASPKPKDVIFCLDVSGSMSGPKLEGLKVVAEKVARRLSQQDANNRVAVVAFEREIHPIHPLSEVTDATFASIQRLQSMGGTYAGMALNYCFQELSESGSKEKYILLVSDGQTVDRWSKVASGVRVVSVGIGTAVNMGYLKDIARETGGVGLAVYPGEDYDTVATTLVGYLAGPVLQDIEVKVDGAPVEDVLGISDVYASMPASLVLKVDKPPSDIQLVGNDCQKKQIEMVVDVANMSECALAHQIWAREKLRDRDLADADLIAISVNYGVLCAKTAFVAVHLREIPGEKPERVEIPVALPHTWDYDKVFGEQYVMHSVRGFSARAVGPTGQSVSATFAEEPIGGILKDLSGSGSLDSTSKSDSPSYESPGVRQQKTDTVYIADMLEDLVDQLDRGCIKRLDAEAAWTILEKLLVKRNTKSWSVGARAKAFCYLLKLRTFGFKVTKEILQLFSAEPDVSDIEAHKWWEKAQQVLGAAAGASS